MKLIKSKDEKFSLVGMTKEEVSVIRSLVGLTSPSSFDKGEENLYSILSEFPRIYYVNTGEPEFPVLSRKETK